MAALFIYSELIELNSCFNNYFGVKKQTIRQKLMIVLQK
uniref:Uncharacterized protein n=1 Tax=Loigolactobacillus rennini TaxID=238013 RepID=A0A1K2I623_9LACO|nr:hypothetical protein LREN565_0900 [Loigolactobacillus rennini]